MTIRKAQKKDLKKIYKIFKLEYSKKPYNEKWPKVILEAKLKEYFKHGFMFILEIEKRIIGFIIGHITLWNRGKVGYIDEVVVLEKFQGRGHGKKLMVHLNNHFRKKGVKNLDLITNPKAKAYQIYKKMGFRKQKDFVYMTKKLK